MRPSLPPLVSVVAVALTACGEGSLAPAPAPTVSVFLTDAPGDVEAVWVEILGISMHGEDGRVELLGAGTELIELTELAGTSVEVVADAEVPAARYHELRFVIGGAVLETTTGEVFTKDGAEHPDGLAATGQLHCPSCSQSGLKVKFPGGGLEVDDVGIAVIADFDVSQSFGKEAGNSGRWVMHPVIHASSMDAGGSVQGAVVLAGGILVPACPAGTAQDLSAFVPTAGAQTLEDAEGMPVVRTGSTAPDGSFSIDHLAPDAYDLGYEANIQIGDHTLTFAADVSAAEATVEAGGTVNGVTYTVNAVTCVGPA